jgi:hypothetical protein
VSRAGLSADADRISGVDSIIGDRSLHFMQGMEEAVALILARNGKDDQSDMTITMVRLQKLICGRFKDASRI